MNDRQAQLRTEALRQLRWQQQWQQAIAQAPPGAPVLTSPNDRVWFLGCLDMRRAAGAEIPQAFYRRGSIIPTSREECREVASISLNALVTDITRALAYVTDDADKEPGETEPTEA